MSCRYFYLFPSTHTEAASETLAVGNANCPIDRTMKRQTTKSTNDDQGTCVCVWMCGCRVLVHRAPPPVSNLKLLGNAAFDLQIVSIDANGRRCMA